LIINDVAGVAPFSHLFVYPMLCPPQHHACSLQNGFPQQVAVGAFHKDPRQIQPFPVILL
jgi:hypothetical protein